MIDEELHLPRPPTLSSTSHGQVFVVSNDHGLFTAVAPRLENVGFSVELLPECDVRRVLYGQALVLDLRGERATSQRQRALVQLLATFRVRPCAVAIIDRRDGLAFAVQHGIGAVGEDVIDHQIAPATERAVRDLRRPRLL